MVERAVLLTDGDTLAASDLQLGPRTLANGTGQMAVVSVPVAAAAAPAPATDGDPSLDLRSALEGLERRMIHEALARAQGNRTEAAALLGLNRTTLVEKLRKYA